MIEDESFVVPARRSATTEHAERVHIELMNQVAASRQAYEQQQALTTNSIPTRRES